MVFTERQTRRRVPRSWLALAVAGLLLIAGCRSTNLRGHGFRNQWGDFVQQLRTPADSDKFWGFDARSREIERDLGVH